MRKTWLKKNERSGAAKRKPSLLNRAVSALKRKTKFHLIKFVRPRFVSATLNWIRTLKELKAHKRCVMIKLRCRRIDTLLFPSNIQTCIGLPSAPGLWKQGKFIWPTIVAATAEEANQFKRCISNKPIRITVPKSSVSMGQIQRLFAVYTSVFWAQEKLGVKLKTLLLCRCSNHLKTRINVRKFAFSKWVTVRTAMGFTVVYSPSINVRFFFMPLTGWCHLINNKNNKTNQIRIKKH